RALAAIDLLVQKNVIAEPDERIRTAILIDHAAYVAPGGDRIGLVEQTHLVTLLNWASSPYVKRLNMAFVLIDPRLSSVSERLTSNPHVAAIEVPLPDEAERQAFLGYHTKGKDLSAFSDYGVPELAKLTAGISLTDLEVLARSGSEAAAASIARPSASSRSASSNGRRRAAWNSSSPSGASTPWSQTAPSGGCSMTPS
ncbi:MAG: hypothetical protein HC863_02430, partial [Myxococcales bacterium]|nr:hypothetical protein [Myxococcales bacterium]